MKQESRKRNIIIEHNIIPNQKVRRREKKVTVDIFPIAAGLYSELEGKGIIDRLKKVKQLGTINVSKKLEKTRYDYVILQLYLHQIIRTNLTKRLKYAYSNRIKIKEYLPDCCLDSSLLKEVTMADILQLLVLAYNIGHFYNTFVASRAVDMVATKNMDFKESLLCQFEDERCRVISSQVLDTHNYQRTHLINSLLILDKCDGNNKSVSIAKEVLLAYLSHENLPGDSKLHYCFDLFRKVRTVAYVAYDLNVAGIPFLLDLSNEKALLSFFDEFLAEYNNTTSAERLVQALTKLLSDDVYNDLDSTICMTQISNKMVEEYNKTEGSIDYYNNYWLDEDSVFNKRYPQNHNYNKHYLKLTFSKDSRVIASKVYEILSKTNNISVGYYLRSSGEMTLAVSIKKSCKDKGRAAFAVFKKVIPYLMQTTSDIADTRYILPVKFLLYYVFNEHNLILKEAKDDKTCTICTRGRSSRIASLKHLLSKGSEDDQHEIEATIKYLKTDTKNDVTIIIPGSTLVLSDSSSQTAAEFDGVIIYPNRKEKQIVLVEAKNMIYNPINAHNCLEDKFRNLGIEYDADEIVTYGHDAYYAITL